MKSIRLSLVVYFLLLLALALGAVSAVVYQTSYQQIADKQRAGWQDHSLDVATDEGWRTSPRAAPGSASR